MNPRFPPSFKDPLLHPRFRKHHDTSDSPVTFKHPKISQVVPAPSLFRASTSEVSRVWFPLQVRGVRVGLAPSFLLLLASISLGFLRKIGDDYDDFLHLSPSPPDLVCIWYEWSPFLILSLSVWAWRLAGIFFGSHLYPPGLIEPNPPLHPERKTGETMGAPQSSPETRPTSPDSLKVEERRRTILAKAA